MDLSWRNIIVFYIDVINIFMYHIVFILNVFFFPKHFTWSLQSALECLKIFFYLLRPFITITSITHTTKHPLLTQLRLEEYSRKKIINTSYYTTKLCAACTIVYPDSDLLYKHVDRVEVASKCSMKNRWTSLSRRKFSCLIPGWVSGEASWKNQQRTESSTSSVEAIKGWENLGELPVRQPGVTWARLHYK